MGEALSREEKLRILRALEEDFEFRYAIMGLIGISEEIKSLREGQNKLLEVQNKLWDEIKSLREDTRKLWEEIKSLRDNQTKLWEEIKNLREDTRKLWEEVKSLREGQNRLWEAQNKLWEEIKRLREEENKLWEEVRSLREEEKRLWEGQNKLWEEVRNLRENQEDMLRDLHALRVSFERLTLSVEDEARDVIRHRLKSDLNLDVPLDRLWIDEREINIYGVSGDVCVIGEATVRLGIKLMEELEGKIEYLRRVRPSLLKPKIIKVIYADYAVPSALEAARKRGVWVLKWSGDLTPISISS